MAWTYNAALFLGAANTGLTLTAALFNGDGTSAAGMTTTYLAEKGSTGNYYFQAQMPDDHRGYVTYTSGGTIKTITTVAPNGSIEYVDQRVTEVAGEVSVSIGASIATAAGAELPSGTTDLSAIRGDSWTLTFVGLGDMTGNSKVWFTLKDDTSKADSLALVQVEKSGGLLYLNGAAGTSGLGTLTVTDAALGNVMVTVDEVATAALAPGTHYRYDVQMLNAGSVRTLVSGKFVLNADVSRAVA